MALLPINVNKLRQHLGYGMARSSILASMAFVICLLFYLYVVGSFFEITIYPLISRVTSYAFFQEHVINEYLDKAIVITATTSWFLLSINNRVIRYSLSITYGASGIIFAAVSPDTIIFDILALLSLPLIISVALYHYKQRKKKNILNSNTQLTLRYISLAVVAISIMWIAVSILSFFIAPDFESLARESYANQLFLLLSSFATVYIFLLVFCLPVKVLFRRAVGVLKLDIKEEDVSQTLSSNNEQNQQRIQTKIGLLLFAMLLSIILVLIPQHPSINTDNQDIGVDTHFYVTWIEELAKSKGAYDFAHQAFVTQGQNGDRPLSLVFLFLVYYVAGGNLSEVIEHFPIILGPGTVLVLYFLTLQLTRNEKISLIAALFGAVSFHTLAGIYAGFYANWLALIVGYTSIAFLFRYLRSGHPSNIVAFSILLIGVLFFHVYTWTILAAVTGIFLLTMLVIQYKRKKNNDSNNNYFANRRIILLLLIAILPSVTVDIGRVLLTGSSGGIEQDIELAHTGLGIEQFNSRWEILGTTILHSLGGVFSNFIILILGLFWVIKSNVREPPTIFLMIFLSAGLVPLFFGSWAIQARVFYDMPFEIPAAIALYYIWRRLGTIVVPLAGCAWLVAASLFTVMNYHLVPVPGM
jgi:hypothetical protein